MKLIKISEQIEEMRPIWKDFIISLGYSEEKAKLFAEGYEEKLKTLPTFEKLNALENQYGPCMIAGFLKAGIDEEEAYRKANPE